MQEERHRPRSTSSFARYFISLSRLSRSGSPRPLIHQTPVSMHLLLTSYITITLHAAPFRPVICIGTPHFSILRNRHVQITFSPIDRAFNERQDRSCDRMNRKVFRARKIMARSREKADERMELIDGVGRNTSLPKDERKSNAEISMIYRCDTLVMRITRVRLSRPPASERISSWSEILGLGSPRFPP